MRRQTRASELVEKLLEGDGQPGYDVPPGEKDQLPPEVGTGEAGEESNEVAIAREIAGLVKTALTDNSAETAEILSKIGDLADQLLAIHAEDPSRVLRASHAEAPAGGEGADRRHKFWYR